MILPALFFYLFAGICVASAFMVIASKNPVHSVLYLILAFVNASGLFVMMGAEFLAMILIVVYVGAVAVLFLFVVMMLDVDFASLRSGFLRYLPIGGLIGLVLLGELVRGLGQDPAVLVRAAGLPARLLDDPETWVPIHAVRALLEMAAIFHLLWESDSDTVPKIVNITVDYLRSAGPRDVIASAKVTKQGRRMVNVFAEAWQDDRSRPVASASAHFLITSADEPPSL